MIIDLWANSLATAGCSWVRTRHRSCGPRLAGPGWRPRRRQDPVYFRETYEVFNPLMRACSRSESTTSSPRHDKLIEADWCARSKAARARQ